MYTHHTVLGPIDFRFSMCIDVNQNACLGGGTGRVNTLLIFFPNLSFLIKLHRSFIVDQIMHTGLRRPA